MGNSGRTDYQYAAEDRGEKLLERAAAADRGTEQEQAGQRAECSGQDVEHNLLLRPCAQDEAAEPSDHGTEQDPDRAAQNHVQSEHKNQQPDRCCQRDQHGLAWVKRAHRAANVLSGAALQSLRSGTGPIHIASTARIDVNAGLAAHQPEQAKQAD